MTLPTQNPIPSSAKNDQLFNAEKIDQVVNSDDLQYTDRFGKKRFTFSGLYDVIQTWLTGLGGTTGASGIGTTKGVSTQTYLDSAKTVFPELFQIGLSSPSHDDLFDAMFTTLSGLDDAQLSSDIPYTIDLHGNTYTLTRSHQLDINFNIVNGTLLMNGGNIVMGSDIGPKTRRHYLKDLKVRYIGTSYFDDALIRMCRSYNSFSINCDFWAGVLTTKDTTDTTKYNRAKYGLWMGSTRAWGCGIIGGEYYGGHICARLGSTNDHTGTTITGGATFHHGATGNLLMCNPAGFSISGVNIEHSEDGAWGLCITSGTNGSSNPAHGGVIEAVYAFNNGNGTAGTTNAFAGIIVGVDAPNTLGFDTAGSLITSDGNAHSIVVRNCYVVSPKQDRAIYMKGLASLKILDNKYTFGGASPILPLFFSGTAARCACIDNRNQSTGLFDEVGYDSSNKPKTGDRQGTYTPTLSGATVAGSFSYSTRGGDYSISNGMCTVSLWITIGSVTTPAQGALSISLPTAISSGKRSGPGGVCALNITGTYTKAISVTNGDGTITSTGTLTLDNNTLAVTAYVLSGTSLVLRLGNAALDGSNITAGTAFMLSLSYPVDGATYQG